MPGARARHGESFSQHAKNTGVVLSLYRCLLLVHYTKRYLPFSFAHTVSILFLRRFSDDVAVYLEIVIHPLDNEYKVLC